MKGRHPEGIKLPVHHIFTKILYQVGLSTFVERIKLPHLITVIYELPQ